MAIFLTGSTGYLGSYLVAGLLTEHRDTLNLLVRAKTEQEAHERLWTSLQLHFAFPEFREFLSTRVRIFRGLLAKTPVDQLTVQEKPVVLFRSNENTWLEAIVRYVVDPKRAGRVKTALLRELLAKLRAAPDRVLIPKGNSR